MVGSPQMRERQQRGNGDDALQQRQAEVLHRYRRQVAEQHHQNEFNGLQLADLPLSGEPQTHDQQRVQQHRAKKRGYHKRSTPFEWSMDVF